MLLKAHFFKRSCRYRDERNQITITYKYNYSIKTEAGALKPPRFAIRPLRAIYEGINRLLFPIIRNYMTRSLIFIPPILCFSSASFSFAVIYHRLYKTVSLYLLRKFIFVTPIKARTVGANSGTLFFNLSPPPHVLNKSI